MTGEDFQIFMIGSVEDLRNRQIACVEALAALRQDMKSVVGNGKPGRLDRCEDNIEGLRVRSAKQHGMAIATIAIASGAISVASVMIECLRWLH